MFECLLVFKLLKLPETASLFKICSFDESLRLPPPPPRLQLLKNEKKLKWCKKLELNGFLF